MYCNNLPLSTTVPDLYDLFGSVGEIAMAELVYDETGTSTGAAVVEYASQDAADVCINKLNGYNYGGRDLHITYASRP